MRKPEASDSCQSRLTAHCSTRVVALTGTNNSTGTFAVTTPGLSHIFCSEVKLDLKKLSLCPGLHCVLISGVISTNMGAKAKMM